MNARRLAAAAIGAGLAVGAVGVIWRLLQGHEPAGYGSYIPWGLWVAMYMSFSGLAAGAFLFFAGARVFGIKRLEPVARLALVTAFVGLVVGMILIGLDLGHLERFWRVYVSGNPSSLMAWMIWFYTGFGVVLAVMLAIAFRPDLVALGGKEGRAAGLARALTFGRSDLSSQALDEDRRRLRALGIAGVVLAVAFSGGLGALMGVLSGRPFAHSPLMPIFFIVSALVTASAFLAAAVAFFWRDRGADWRRLVWLLGRVTLVLLLVDVLLEWAEVSVSLYASLPATRDAYELMLTGDYWYVFWIFHVVLGVLLPLAMLTRWGRAPGWVGAAAALVLVSMSAVRLNIVIPGLAVPQIEGLESAWLDDRLTYDYVPSLMEWLVLLFAVSVFAALLVWAARSFPLLGPLPATIGGGSGGGPPGAARASGGNPGRDRRDLPLLRTDAASPPDPAGPGSLEARGAFLATFASGVFAGLVAPAVIGGRVGSFAQAALAQEESGAATTGTLVPLPDVPEGINGEDPIVRMMADLRRALRKPVEERRWAMVIDLRKCTGCNGCTIACIQENKLPPGVVYRPVIEEVSGTYPNLAKRFIPRPCMQCDAPPCVPVCPVKATWKRADGIVTIDYNKCIGCRYCLAACPYSARTFDFGEFYGDERGGGPEEYEKLPSLEYAKTWRRSGDDSPIGNARKCHFCLHRIEQGLLPACVLSCMGRATFFGDANDPESLIAELIASPNVMRLKEELGTKPKVYYLT